MEKFVIHSGDSRDAVLQEFARGLKFPEYFGKNLDALADCLGDLSWLPKGRKLIEWWVDPEFEAGDGRRFIGTVRAIVGSTVALRDDIEISIRVGSPDIPDADPGLTD